MRYIHFYGNNGYCGTDYDEFMEFDDSVQDSEINNTSADLAYGNAETYEHVATGWNGEFESEEEREQYYEDACGYCGWEEVSKEEYEELKENFS